MKQWVRILFLSIVGLAVILGGIYLFFTLNGKAMMIKQLEKITQRKVSIGYFNLRLPLNLEIKDVRIENLAKIDSVFITPSIPRLIAGIFALNKVVISRPEITYEKALPTVQELVAVGVEASRPAGVSSPALISAKTPAPAPKSPPPFIIKQLKIENGTLNYFDHTVGQNGIKITVKDLFFNLSDLYALPRSAIATFELQGKIPWQEGVQEGKVELNGWANFFKKDMQAELKIQDIDGIYLYPYYSQWVNLEKARIEKAKLNFLSNIGGLNDDINAQCHLELTDIVFKERPPEEGAKKEEKIASAVLDIFRALNEGKIVLDFNFKTKMDRPEFGFANIKMAFEEKLAEGRKADKFSVFMLPGKIVQGAVKGASDISQAVISGAASVGKELKKSVEGAFNR